MEEIGLETSAVECSVLLPRFQLFACLVSFICYVYACYILKPLHVNL